MLVLINRNKKGLLQLREIVMCNNEIKKTDKFKYQLAYDSYYRLAPSRISTFEWPKPSSITFVP